MTSTPFPAATGRRRLTHAEQLVLLRQSLRQIQENAADADSDTGAVDQTINLPAGVVPIAPPSVPVNMGDAITPLSGTSQATDPMPPIRRRLTPEEIAAQAQSWLQSDTAATPTTPGGNQSQPNQPNQSPYAYEPLPDVPNLPGLPTRNRRGEARQAGMGALGTVLGLLFTGNKDMIPTAVSANLRGTRQGQDARADDELRQTLAQIQQTRERYGFQRQRVQDVNAAIARQQGLDAAGETARLRAASDMVRGFPAFEKNLRESNPQATPRELGQMAKAYVDKADMLAGGPGRSGLVLRQLEIKPSEASIAITDEDGNVITPPVKEDAGGIFPVVDPLQPKIADTLAPVKAGNEFIQSLYGLTPEAVQSRVRIADESGDLEKYGLTIPKDKDGNYQIDVSRAPTFKATDPPEIVHAKQVAADLKYARDMYKDAHTTAEGRKFWAKQISLKESALGVGPGAPIPPGLRSDLTPAEKQAAADRAAGRAVQIRGQDKAAATAAANRAARASSAGGGDNELKRSRALGSAYSKVMTATKQIESLRQAGDSPTNRVLVAAAKRRLMAAQSELRAMGADPSPGASKAFFQADQEREQNINAVAQPVNYGGGVDEFQVPGGARFGMKQLGDRGFGADIHDVKTDAEGNTVVWFEPAKTGGRWKSAAEGRAFRVLKSSGATDVRWKGNGYFATFPGEAAQKQKEQKARRGKTPGGRDMTIEEVK